MPIAPYGPEQAGDSTRDAGGHEHAGFRVRPRLATPAAPPDRAGLAWLRVPHGGKASLAGRLLGGFQACEYVRNFVSRYAWMRADSLLLVSGAFAGYRREALATVGGFDPECLVEDYEIIHRLHRHARPHRLDWRVRVVGRACARTSAPSDIGAFLRQRRRWFAGLLQTQLWNRDMIGNPRFGKLGRLMLPIKTMDTVQPFLGLAASATLAGLVIGGHLGAALGWHHFFTGRRHWGKQTRHAMR